MPRTDDSSEELFALASARLLSFLKGQRLFYLVSLLGAFLLVRNGLSERFQAWSGVPPAYAGAGLLAAACLAALFFIVRVRQAARPAIEEARKDLDDAGTENADQAKNLRVQLAALEKFYARAPLVASMRTLVCAVLAGVATLTGAPGWGCAAAMTILAELMLEKTIRLLCKSLKG